MPEHFSREAVFRKCVNVTEPYINDDVGCVYDPKCLNQSSTSDVKHRVLLLGIERSLCEICSWGVWWRRSRELKLRSSGVSCNWWIGDRGIGVQLASEVVLHTKCNAIDLAAVFNRRVYTWTVPWEWEQKSWRGKWRIWKGKKLALVCISTLFTLCPSMMVRCILRRIPKQQMRFQSERKRAQ